MRGYAVGKLERQVKKTHTHWRTFLKVTREPRMLVNSYSVEREISGSISSVGSILRILKYLRNKGTSFALHCPTLEWHHDDYLYPVLSLEGDIKRLRLRANRRNNSQHCRRNNVGSCCVRVGSGLQTDATTPNNVGTCSASWEGYNP